MVTGIKPLLGEVLALKQELTGRESHALEASANAVAGGWENPSRSGEKEGLTSLYRAPPEQGASPKLLSPRLLVYPPDSADAMQRSHLLAGRG